MLNKVSPGILNKDPTSLFSSFSSYLPLSKNVLFFFLYRGVPLSLMCLRCLQTPVSLMLPLVTVQLSIVQGVPLLSQFSLVSTMGFFSEHKSSSTGSIPVSPNRHGIKQENKSSHLTFRTCKLMHMTGSKKYSLVGAKVQSRVSLDL